MIEEDPVRIPFDGVLDLHAFRPKDVKDLVSEYLRECRAWAFIRSESSTAKEQGASGRSFIERSRKIIMTRVSKPQATEAGTGGPWKSSFIRNEVQWYKQNPEKEKQLCEHFAF
jgi:hypothetical protein